MYHQLTVRALKNIHWPTHIVNPSCKFCRLTYHTTPYCCPFAGGDQVDRVFSGVPHSSIDLNWSRWQRLRPSPSCRHPRRCPGEHLGLLGRLPEVWGCLFVAPSRYAIPSTLWEENQLEKLSESVLFLVSMVEQRHLYVMTRKFPQGNLPKNRHSLQMKNDVPVIGGNIT